MSFAKRVTQLDKPTIWCAMKEVAQQTGSVDLGNGTASGSPPQFYLKNLESALAQNFSEQNRQQGTKNLKKAIANYHKHEYANLNPQQNIVVLNGAHVGMYACIAAFINPGDEIIVFDPSYTYYRKQAFIHQGIVIGVHLTPKKQQSRQLLKERIKTEIKFQENDQWIFSHEQLKKAFTAKTKMIILNSPHNPTGKIFSNQDIQFIATLLDQHPQAIIIEDNIYETYAFDHFSYSSILKFSQRKAYQNRCLSIYSAGKLFKATGVRIGWVLGPKDLIAAVSMANHYMYLQNSPILQKCIQLSLKDLENKDNKHSSQELKRLQRNRNILINELVQTNLDINLWIPQSGYFVMIDISKLDIKKQYLKDENGNPRSLDYASAFQFANENGVSVIPCFSFYDKNTKNIDKYIRLAFCKDEELLIETGKRLRKQN